MKDYGSLTTKTTWIPIFTRLAVTLFYINNNKFQLNFILTEGFHVRR